MPRQRGSDRELTESLGSPELLATSEHDRGQVALACGDYEQAAGRFIAALDHEAPGSRPLARLALAEALIQLGRCDDAQEQLRATVLEPVQSGDMPDTLVPRLTRLQGLVAARRGAHAVAVRRLTEAAGGWRRLLGCASRGDNYAAVLADFGRPPVTGLVEPVRNWKVSWPT